MTRRVAFYAAAAMRLVPSPLPGILPPAARVLRSSPALRAHDPGRAERRDDELHAYATSHGSLRVSSSPRANRLDRAALEASRVSVQVRFFSAKPLRQNGRTHERAGGWGSQLRQEEKSQRREKNGDEGEDQGWWGQKVSPASWATGCIVVAGCSAATLDLTNMQSWGTGELKDSVLFSALLARCESWNLSQQVQKNKGKSAPRNPKEADDWAKQNEIDNRKIEDYYELGPELGAGVHAVVRRGKNKTTKELVAIKCVEKANMRRRQLAREIEILTTVSHPNVIALKDVFEDDCHVYLVLELVQGGELFDKIVQDGAFSEREAAKLVRKITEALQYLHSRKVCHRDLKPENLLLTSKGADADVKIADFGLSKIMGEKTMMKRSCGTWAYWAPEILRRQPYDYSVDLWSVGVILYIMLSGVHPFDPGGQSSDAQIVERILRADYKFDPEYWSHVSPAAKDVVKSLIHMDPMQRLTCAQLLKHPWVAGTDNPTTPIPKDALQNLQSFTLQNRTQFGQGLVGLVASQALMRKVNRSQLFEDEIEDMRAIFMSHTADSREEMERCEHETEGNCWLPALKLGATMRALGENISDRDAMRLALNSSIIDSTGRVSFSSFVAIMAHHVEGRETEEDLKRAFTYLDTQNKGLVSVSDIQRALALMGVRMTEDNVRDMVRVVDKENKGKITFQQFQLLFRNVNQRPKP